MIVDSEKAPGQSAEEIIEARRKLWQDEYIKIRDEEGAQKNFRGDYAFLAQRMLATRDISPVDFKLAGMSPKELFQAAYTVIERREHGLTRRTPLPGRRKR